MIRREVEKTLQLKGPEGVQGVPIGDGFVYASGAASAPAASASASDSGASDSVGQDGLISKRTHSMIQYTRSVFFHVDYKIL